MHYYTCTYPCTHYLDEDTEHFSIVVGSLIPFSVNTHLGITTKLTAITIVGLLSILEFHKNRVIQNVHVCVWLISLHTMLRRSSWLFFYHCGFIYFCSVKMPPFIHPPCFCWWTGGVLRVLACVNLDPLTMAHGGCVLSVSVVYTEKWISESPALFLNAPFIILSSFSKILWMPSSTSWWSILRVTSMTSSSLMLWWERGWVCGIDINVCLTERTLRTDSSCGPFHDSFGGIVMLGNQINEWAAVSFH